MYVNLYIYVYIYVNRTCAGAKPTEISQVFSTGYFGKEYDRPRTPFALTLQLFAEEVRQPEHGILEVVMNKGTSAMSPRFVRELHKIFGCRALPTHQIRVLILRGEGAAFCA